MAVVVVTALTGVCACRDAGPTPPTPALALHFDEPVLARFVVATGIFVAEFPVTVSDPNGSGGTLLSVETTIFNRSRGVLVATNRRPNVSYVFPDIRVPPHGSLTVQAGVGFDAPPLHDEVAITVRIRLTDDREIERTAPLHRQS